LVFLAAAPKVLVRQFAGLLQTVAAVALFFVASLNSFKGSGWLAVLQLAGVVFNKSSLPLFGFASAASRESPVWAANKASQATPNSVALAGSVRSQKGVYASYCIFIFVVGLF
jgi:hypothetical protein